MTFADRRQAGRLLANQLAREPDLGQPIVFGLARGGVPVAYEIAKRIGAPLEVLVVRKLGSPRQPEYGLGAVIEGGYHWIDFERAGEAGVSRSELEQILDLESAEVMRRVARYRGIRPRESAMGKTAIVVDDGLATGATARVACRSLRREGASRVLLAAPVCSPEAARMLGKEVDRLIVLEEPKHFFAVGEFYSDFHAVSDEEATSLLDETRTKREDVSVQEESIDLPGILAIPTSPRGVVLFAHGSGSSRFSPRNKEVAAALNRAGFATLLFDLLNHEESQDRRNVFEIGLLARRLLLATRWVNSRIDLPIGYFGASTGAAAALWAASELGDRIAAIVSRGGRPDLAIPKLSAVTAPTLLIVGERDQPVIEMNETAAKRLKSAELKVVPGATHLFEEPGALETVARLATSWFGQHLRAEAWRTSGRGAEGAWRQGVA